MTNSASNSIRPARALTAVLLPVIVLGVWLGLDGLARKPLWYDEVATVLHLSGNTEAELRLLRDGRPLAGRGRD